MAQPNVAREPSMDEILASIRKIIETNDAPPQPELAPEPALPAQAAEDFAAPVVDLDEPASVTLLHAPQAPQNVAEEPAAEPPSAQPAMSLADVAARVRAASERHALTRIAEPVTAQPAMVQPIEIDLSDEPEAAAEEPAAQESTALVSPAVGERVAQSFGALAEAVDAGPRRSFDEIAEEMLRPMLREWLDDNLPTLVERLVREEIERVARGPRR